MASAKICDNVYSVGVLNPNLRIFDVVMKTEFGTSYNSYLVRGTEKTALIETTHFTYLKQYLENIESVCPLDKIDYIVMNHNEPDHSGVLEALLERMPNVTVVVSQAGSIYLKNITNNPNIRLQIAKDGDVLDLGGRTLRFINAPFLHWPDSMFTWMEEEKILFSCDFLGAHYCEPSVFDTNIVYEKSYEQAFKGYFDAIFGPFKPYVRKGLDKIKGLDLQYVCTSHGPVLTQNGKLPYTIEKYTEWSEQPERGVPLIPIFYCSAYGNTGKLAHAIAQGVSKVLPNAEVPVYDLNENSSAQMQAVLNESTAFAVGSPTINKDAVPPVWELLSHIDAINCQKKAALVFGSYGWSGEAIPGLVARLTSLKCKVFETPVKTVFVPSEEDLNKARELGEQFAGQI